MTADILVQRDASRQVKSKPSPLVRFADMTTRPREYLWHRRLIKRGYCCIAGKGGFGKTTFSVAVAAWASTGRWPGTNVRSDPVSALIIEKQDDGGDEIKPKLLANGYDPSRVFALPVGPHGLPSMPTMATLRTYIREHQLGLVVLSPLDAFLVPESENRYPKMLYSSRIEMALDELNAIGLDNDCLIIGIKHVNKKIDLDADQRVSGATAYVNSAREVLFGSYDRRTDRRSLEMIKGNSVEPFEYDMRLEDVGAQFGAHDERTAYVRVDLEESDFSEVQAASMSDQRHELVMWFEQQPPDVEFSAAEVAEALGRPVPTMKTQLSRAVNAGLIKRPREGRYTRR